MRGITNNVGNITWGQKRDVYPAVVNVTYHQSWLAAPLSPLSGLHCSQSDTRYNVHMNPFPSLNLSPSVFLCPSSYPLPLPFPSTPLPLSSNSPCCPFLPTSSFIYLAYIPSPPSLRLSPFFPLLHPHSPYTLYFPPYPTFLSTIDPPSIHYQSIHACACAWAWNKRGKLGKAWEIGTWKRGTWKSVGWKALQ